MGRRHCDEDAWLASVPAYNNIRQFQLESPENVTGCRTVPYGQMTKQQVRSKLYSAFSNKNPCKAKTAETEVVHDGCKIYATPFGMHQIYWFKLSLLSCNKLRF